MRTLFDRLNSPTAVLVVFALFLIMDGLLLYRYQQSLPTAESDVGTTSLVEEGKSGQTVSSTYRVVSSAEVTK